jgi:hypothetical protein
MKHDEFDRRFYTYIHKDVDGNVVYVGSGSDRRYKRPTGRTKKHIEIFDKLDKQIVESDLTKQESIEKEMLLYDKYAPFGKLINERRPSKALELDHKELSTYFEYDENSPTFLKRKVDVLCGKQGFPKYKAGDVAGNISTSGYGTVSFKSKRYSLHRVIWSIVKQQNVPKNLVIDHIDNNPSNNKIDNLRVYTYADNSLNRKTFDEFTGITYQEKSKSFVLRIHRAGFLVSKIFNTNILFPDDNECIAKQKAIDLALEYKQSHLSSDSINIQRIENLLLEKTELYKIRVSPLGIPNITYEGRVKRFRVITHCGGKRKSKNFHIVTYGTYDAAFDAAKEYLQNMKTINSGDNAA